MRHPWIPALLLALPLSAGAAQTLEIAIQGMTCPFCVHSVERTLDRLPGVADAQVSLEQKKARLLLEPGAAVDEAAVREAIVSSGFTPGEARVVDEETAP